MEKKRRSMPYIWKNTKTGEYLTISTFDSKELGRTKRTRKKVYKIVPRDSNFGSIKSVTSKTDKEEARKRAVDWMKGHPNGV